MPTKAKGGRPDTLLLSLLRIAPRAGCAVHTQRPRMKLPLVLAALCHGVRADYFVCMYQCVRGPPPPGG